MFPTVPQTSVAHFSLHARLETSRHPCSYEGSLRTVNLSYLGRICESLCEYTRKTLLQRSPIMVRITVYVFSFVSRIGDRSSKCQCLFLSQVQQTTTNLQTPRPQPAVEMHYYFFSLDHVQLFVYSVENAQIFRYFMTQLST